jgi:hypothetical protein
MTAKKTLRAVVVIAAVVGSGTPASADDKDHGKFNNRSLKGAWGFNVHGFLGANTASPLPTSAVGRTVYDGSGGCTTDAKLNAGGTVLPLTSTSCTYTVNPDGTGTQLTTFGPPAPPPGAFTTDFVLVDGAKEFLFIVSDTTQPGSTVGSGVAKRQR